MRSLFGLPVIQPSILPLLWYYSKAGAILQSACKIVRREQIWCELRRHTIVWLGHPAAGGTGQASGSGEPRSALAATIAATGNGVPASPQRHRRAAFPSAPHSKLSRRARIYSERILGEPPRLVSIGRIPVLRSLFGLPVIQPSILPLLWYYSKAGAILQSACKIVRREQIWCELRSAPAATIAAAGNGVPASPQRHRRAAFPSAPHSKLSRRARIYSERNLFGANKFMVQPHATALQQLAFAARSSRYPIIHSSNLPFFHCSNCRYRRGVPLRAERR